MSAAAPSTGQGVLDTSTVILLARLTDATGLPAEPLITTITLAELSVGPLVAGDERERMARQAHLQQAEADFDPLPFDAAARAFGRVAASLHRANILFATAAASRQASLVGVLGSLYPITTVLLARVLLRERVRSWQDVGVVATLVGVAIVAAASGTV